MLPNDFVSRITFDALRTDIPGRNSALGIQHEDSIIFYTGHQKPKLLVRLVRHPAGFPLPHLIKAAGKLYLNIPFVYQGFQLTAKSRRHSIPSILNIDQKCPERGSTFAQNSL